MLHALRYLIWRNGLLAAPPYDLSGFVRTRPNLDRPDAQLVACPFSMDVDSCGGFSDGIKFEEQPGIQMLGYYLRPRSRGSVMLNPLAPEGPPVIDPNYLSHEYDREVAISIVRYIRNLFGQDPLKPYIAGETFPGAEFQSDAEILNAYSRYGGTGYHAAGTCSMGVDVQAGAVVDKRLKVHGIAGLRVADISVFPTLVSGNTNGPASVTGWRASELILEDQLQT